MATAVGVGYRIGSQRVKKLKEGLINVLNIAYSGWPWAVTC